MQEVIVSVYLMEELKQIMTLEFLKPEKYFGPFKDISSCIAMAKKQKFNPFFIKKRQQILFLHSEAFISSRQKICGWQNMQLIKYYRYVTVEDERSIVLRKDQGFTVNLHVVVSVIFILHGKEYVFIHIDCVNLVLGLKHYGIFWVIFERMNSQP